MEELKKSNKIRNYSEVDISSQAHSSWSTPVLEMSPHTWTKLAVLFQEKNTLDHLNTAAV